MTVRKNSSAMVFICLMGVVSLFADMVQEGARGIFGAYLGMMGASAAMVGCISGAGELAGYGLRFVTGIIASRSGKYWFMTVGGHALAVLAIPCLAFVPDGNWMMAACFIILGRVGKAIRQPAKSTLLSYAASREGLGKSFAIQEFLDQLGAFLGPVLIFWVLSYYGSQGMETAYGKSFLFLGIPAFLCIAAVILAKIKFPDPEKFEPEVKETKEAHLGFRFKIYMVGTALFAFGFIDFPIVALHAVKSGLAGKAEISLLYAAAMAADAFSALFFGWLYDKYGTVSLAWSTLLSMPFVFFIFMAPSSCWLYAGVLLWGIGMGAQESTLKATVAAIVPKHERAVGYGIFETGFGVSWFIGSFLLGILYDASILWMAAISALMQAAAVPFFFLTGRQKHRLEV